MKYILILVLSLIFTGCIFENLNELRIVNDAHETINVYIRAEEHAIRSGRELVIKDIPNGAYEYSVTYALPTGTTGSTTSGDVAGYAAFSYSNTKVLLTYSSNINGGTYELFAVQSTSHSSGTTDLVSPGH